MAGQHNRLCLLLQAYANAMTHGKCLKSSAASVASAQAVQTAVAKALSSSGVSEVHRPAMATKCCCMLRFYVVSEPVCYSTSLRHTLLAILSACEAVLNGSSGGSAACSEASIAQVEAEVPPSGC